MGSTARSPRVRARVTPHRGQGESLVPLNTRESVSLSLSLSRCRHRSTGSYAKTAVLACTSAIV